eukprot:TRINITY_DN9018_c0_g1_i1.p1 TRINITY_DN9018_c0_g1~~TRINITY_DN9018_c0_g1_i1.p1  ORF type:complete len:475 (-),score=117.98 TRINITY_DN9018_c0_g1_i1:22-1446(-)
MCRPDHWLYNQANEFFLRRPYLDLHGEIPMFHALFNSTKPELYLRERSFALQMLASGISDGDDVLMCQKKNIYSVLTSFADSGISDLRTRQLVFDTLSALIVASPASPNTSLDYVFVSPSAILNSGLASWLHFRLLDLLASFQVIHVYKQIPDAHLLSLGLSLIQPLFSLTMVLTPTQFSSSLPFALVEPLQPLLNTLIDFSLLFLSFSSSPPASALSLFSAPLSFSSTTNLFLTGASSSSSVPFPLPVLYLATTLHLLRVVQSESRVSFLAPSKILHLVDTCLTYFGGCSVTNHAAGKRIPHLESFLASIVTATTYSESLLGGRESEVRALSKLMVWVLSLKVGRSTSEFQPILEWVFTTLVKTGSKDQVLAILESEHHFSSILRAFYLWHLGGPLASVSTEGSASSLLLLNAISLFVIQKQGTKEQKSILENPSITQLLSLHWKEETGFGNQVPAQVNSSQISVAFDIRRVL